MTYSFDTIIERDSTFATKTYVPHVEMGHPNSSNLWVADMDFAVCPAITEALVKRAEHPIYGYTEEPESIKDAFREWFEKRHDIHFTNEEVVLNTGVLPAYSCAIRIISEKDDEFIVFAPTYKPFVSKLMGNGRKPVFAPLKGWEDHFVFDFEAMEALVNEKTKAVVLCNPHNPTGRVYTTEELRELAAFAQKHNRMILSDEIHCDLAYKPFHTIMDINDYTRNHTISLYSIGKTFNLAGMKMAACVIKNPELREKFEKEAGVVGVLSLNTMGLVAFEAAYRNGSEWLDECKAYIRHNIEWTVETFRTNFPDLHFEAGEGTYLVWIDLGAFDLQTENIQKYLLEEADVFVSAGDFFGEAYKNYIRLNMATPFANVERGVNNIIRLLKK